MRRSFNHAECSVKGEIESQAWIMCSKHNIYPPKITYGHFFMFFYYKNNNFSI